MINQTRESVRVEVAKHLVFALKQSFQLNFERHRTRTDHILDLKFSKVNFVSSFCDSSSILFSSIKAQLLTFSTSDNHFASLEDQCRCTSRFFHTHNDSGKSFGIVLGISALKSNIL